MAGILKYFLTMESTLRDSVEKLKELIRLWIEFKDLVDDKEAIANIEKITATVEAETEAMEDVLNNNQ